MCPWEIFGGMCEGCDREFDGELDEDDEQSFQPPLATPLVNTILFSRWCVSTTSTIRPGSDSAVAFIAALKTSDEREHGQCAELKRRK